ncbi:hypothetical protein V6N13_020131 [Hibiscus sabdariffa]
MTPSKPHKNRKKEVDERSDHSGKVKRPFRGIRIQDVATSIPSEQVSHHHRPSTKPPSITADRWMMNSGNNSMSQPTTATANFPTNDQ